MDLKTVNLADERTWRWTRAGMVACFIVASVMLIASLAMANGSTATVHMLSPLTH
jgi:hypothetical protein